MKKYLPWLVLAVYWPMIFIGTHLPKVDVPPIYGRDRTLHFSAFLLLTLFFWLARYGSERPNFFRRGLYLTLLIMACYGAMDEITQPLVHRTRDFFDWLSDITGVMTALVGLFLLRRCVYWLVIYWIVMFIITHWPEENSAFVKLPLFWQQFQVAYVMISYVILTLLWWRSVGRQPRFVYTPGILTWTLLVLGGYAFLDEWINRAIGRGFDRLDFFSGCGGIAVGIVCAVLLAHHHHHDNIAA